MSRSFHSILVQHGVVSPHDSMSSTDMPCNDKIAGLTGSAAASRADMAIKEFKLGLLSDLKRPLSLKDRLQGQYELAVYVVSYVSMDVVVLSAPAVLLEPDARTTTWYAAFELLGNTDLARLVLVEHAVG